METEQNSNETNTNPIVKKEEVEKSKDKHIDQDFEGYPHHPAKENIIHPKTEDELQIAGSGDEEEFKNVKPEIKEDDSSKEILHNGSGGAFEATEEVDHNPDDPFDEKRKQKNDTY
jgi:hypothetical protein